jgi:hypothetical protein
MVQKGKVEETVFESIPQVVIQTLNSWLLRTLQNLPPQAVFSITLSIVSLSNTMWYYAYWNLFRCMPIRDVPSPLSLYNYKLSGVKDGFFSFSRTSSAVSDIELSEIMNTVVVSDTVLNEKILDGEIMNDEPKSNMPKKISRVGMHLPDSNNANDTHDNDLRGVTHMRDEIEKLREQLKRLSGIDRESAVDNAHLTKHPADDVSTDNDEGVQVLNSAVSKRAAVTLQSATRGHFSRSLFQARRRELRNANSLKQNIYN